MRNSIRRFQAVFAALTFFIGHASVSAAPALTATKDDGVTVKQLPAPTFISTNTIPKGTAVGTTDATGVEFKDLDIANSNNLVVPLNLSATPVAIDDNY